LHRGGNIVVKPKTVDFGTSAKKINDFSDESPDKVGKDGEESLGEIFEE